MNIDQDEREWSINLVMSNRKCPHLFYPNVMHACKIRESRNEKDIRCRLELCPFFGEQLNEASDPRTAKGN